MDARRNKINLLMLPLLAHGHISPFLELSNRLAKRNFHIYICTTKANFNSVKRKISAEYSKSIEHVELELPSSPELPSEYHTGNGLPSDLLVHLDKVKEKGGPFSKVLAIVKPNLVIYDIHMTWAHGIASSYGIPSVQFLTFGATITLFYMHLLEKPSDEFPFQEIYLREYEKEKTQMKLSSWAKMVRDSIKGSREILLVKACVEIEGKYINLLLEDDKNGKIFQWLKKKERGSVVFVSFGSEGFLSKEEMHGLTKGLELSMVKFIWVLRVPFGLEINVQEALPFSQRVGNRWSVYEVWAPQAAILSHPNIGGFVSHCR